MKNPKIYIVLPLLDYREHLVTDFLTKNNFLLNLSDVKIFLKTTEKIIINHSKIISYAEPDKSIYDAWNQSVTQLNIIQKGQPYFVAFCGIDDVLNEQFLSNAQLKLASDIDILFGDIVVNVNNKLKYKHANPNSTMLTSSKNKSWDIYHPGMVMSSKLFNEFSFDIDYSLAADFKFFTEISNRLNLKTCHLRFSQAVININGISNQPNARKIYFSELRRIERECDIDVTGFNWAIENLKLKILKSPIGGFVRNIYWAMK